MDDSIKATLITFAELDRLRAIESAAKAYRTKYFACEPSRWELHALLALVAPKP